MNSTLFIGMDFEGSGGTQELTDRAVQIGMTSLILPSPTPSADNLPAPSVLFESLINPRQYVTSYAYRVHGISGRSLRGAPSFRDLKEKLKTLFDSSHHASSGVKDVVLVAHSCSSEKRYLKEILSETEVHSLKWVDTLALCRRFHPELENHKLETCLKGIGCRKDLEELLPKRGWHDALYDSMASLLILRSLLTRNPTKHLPVEELVRLSKKTPNSKAKRKGGTPKNDDLI